MKNQMIEDDKDQIDNLESSTKSMDFSKINKNKIEDYIDLMKEHQINCAKSGNFIEAELAKQRIIQLTKKQDKKRYIKIIKRQSVDRNYFIGLKDQKLKEFKKEINNKFAEEIIKYKEMLDSLKKKHKDELNEYFTNFIKNNPKELKPSIALIERQKKLEYYIKKEE